jgi:cytoskeletal protein CcmA (bactofilin family)
LLFDLTQTGCSDCDPTKEGGQPAQVCNNGNITGTINGNVTVAVGQNCIFKSPCEITGNLTINGGNVYLGCTLDGSLTENGGTLKLGTSASVGGSVNISQASAFTIGPAAAINGSLQIRNLPANLPQPGVVCGTKVKGNLTVQNNQSPIQIGEPPQQQNCPGNTIGGSLQCTGNNPVPTSGSNNVAAQNQCSG